MNKNYSQLDNINEKLNIKYSSYSERVRDKLTLPIKYKLLLALLPVILLPLFLLIKFEIPIDLFWALITILLFIQFVGGVIYLIGKNFVFKKYLVYKIRFFNEFLILPHKYYFIRMKTKGSLSNFNIVIFFKDIESYKIENTKLRIKFKEKTTERLDESYQKLIYLINAHKDLNLPRNSLNKYPFLNSYTIDNLSKKQIFEIENLLNKKQIMSEK